MIMRVNRRTSLICAVVALHPHLLPHHRHRSVGRVLSRARVRGGRRLPIRDEAINVFLNQPGDGEPRLELTYNFGVDHYELGTGYGHIAITVDDLDGTLARLAGQGIEPERPPYTVREGGRGCASCVTRTAIGSR